MAAAKAYCKLAFQITDIKSIPYLIEKAVKVALSGRPGPVYIDIPVFFYNNNKFNLNIFLA